MEGRSAASSFLWGALVTLVTALLVAVTAFVDYHHFGIGALPEGVIMVAPLALVCGLAAALLGPVTRRAGVRERFLLGLALGGGLGTLWALILSRAIVLSLSQPLFAGLLIGGGFGLASGLASRPPRRPVSRLHEAMTLCALALALGLSYDTLATLLPGHQKLTIAFARSTGNDDPKALPPTAPVREALAKAGVRGRMEVTSISEHGRGRAALAVIVLEHPLGVRVKLPEPDGNAIVYLQLGDRFQIEPAGAHTLPRFIELYPVDHGPDATLYVIHLPDGSVQGGTALFWPQAPQAESPP